MHDDLGNSVYEEPRRTFRDVPALEPPARNYSEDTARAIDKAVRQLVDAAFRRSEQLLEARRPALEAGARRLLEKETLTDVDLRQLLHEVEELPQPLAPVAVPAGGEVGGRGGESASTSSAGPTGTTPG